MVTIGLDLRPTEAGFKAHFGRGTGRYTQEVVQALLALQSSSKLSKEMVLKACAAEELRQTDWERSFLGLTPIGKITLETQFMLPRRLRSLGVDLMHFFSHGDAPARSKVPYVVTVLDLIPLKFAEMYKANKPTLRYHLARFLELQAIKQARGIFAISECTKRDLMELLAIPAERIVVTPLAHHLQCKPRLAADIAELEAIKRKSREQLALPVERPMLLYVGGIDPRKNIAFMLKAFAKLKTRLDPRPLLVMVGRYEHDSHHYPEFLQTIKSLGLEQDISLPGFVSDEDLLKCYHAADSVVFPSLYEGFGLPVLESMACGVPVIAGNNSSIPEVADSSALLLGDLDEDGWLSGMERMLLSPETQLDYSRRGINRASRFSWSKTAEKTIEGYLRFTLGSMSSTVAPESRSPLLKQVA